MYPMYQLADVPTLVYLVLRYFGIRIFCFMFCRSQFQTVLMGEPSLDCPCNDDMLTILKPNKAIRLPLNQKARPSLLWLQPKINISRERKSFFEFSVKFACNARAVRWTWLVKVMDPHIFMTGPIASSVCLRRLYVAHQILGKPTGI